MKKILIILFLFSIVLSDDIKKIDFNADSTKMNVRLIHFPVMQFSLTDTITVYTMRYKTKSGKIVLDTIIYGRYKPRKIEEDSIIF